MTRQLYAVMTLLFPIVLFTNQAQAQEVDIRFFDEIVDTSTSLGISFVVKGGNVSPEIYWSHNDIDYYPLEIVVCSCGAGGFTVRVLDPRNESRGQFKVQLSRRGMQQPYIITVENDTNIYTDIGGTQSFSKWTFHPFPQVRVPVHLFSTSDGTFIYVSMDKYAGADSSTKTFKLFVGPAGKLESFPIENMVTVEDNIDIRTAKGQLTHASDVPQPLSVWQGQQISKLDIEKYIITEAGDVVTIGSK